MAAIFSSSFDASEVEGLEILPEKLELKVRTERVSQTWKHRIKQM